VAFQRKSFKEMRTQRQISSNWITPLTTTTIFFVLNQTFWYCNSWTTNNPCSNRGVSQSRQQNHPGCYNQEPSLVGLFSTPFELDYYEDFDNPFDVTSESESSSLACPPDTKLVIGLNKYSHDTTLCAADAKTGKVLFAVSKERLTRVKHDAGNVAGLVETCLDALNLNYDDDAIETVVMNNHHHRILPLEKDRRHLQWEIGLGINGGNEDGYDDEYNLLDSTGVIQRLELSHHLAHAYSTATQAPFDKGMVVVMDGMGETYRTMMQAKQVNDESYVSDLSFPHDKDKEFAFDCIPSNISEQARSTPFDWREAESVYVFEKKANTIDLRPVFKRFTPENTPPTLYNHGFENMDSVGALYSRASSHIFGDWNACGKVMGLAPWMQHSWNALQPLEGKRRIMWGTLYAEDEDSKFQFDRSVISGMPLISRMDSDLFDAEGNIIPKRRYDFDDNTENNSRKSGNQGGGQEESRLPTNVALEAITLAHRVQIDLEEVLIDFVKHFKESTGEQNLCIAGGVGLNSVLNGRLSRELGFKDTYISPYPGDDGIAVGCCAYGLFGNAILDQMNSQKEAKKNKTHRPPIWRSPFPPYLGPDPSEASIKAAIEYASPWLEVERVRDQTVLLNMVAQEIEIGGVVAWYQGRSELGPRALGHRSILADPRKKGLVRFINQQVKKRESFRPFAPSVLVEHASEWFELNADGTKNDGSDTNSNVSPYMSLTAMVRKEKRSLIPAVTHVDGSSRLQTVTPEAEPLYHKLITKFFELTGVPMVLNTSFNTLPGEPIVESPKDAIRSFLSSMGSIEMLVMGDYVIKRKQPSLRKLLGESDKKGEEITMEPSCPKRTGPCTFETTFEADDDEMDENSIITKTRVRMPLRPMHYENGGAWFQLLDELEGELLSVADGTNTLNEILAQYTAVEKGKAKAAAKERVEETQVLLQNVVHRLVRLYEHTLISW
jgi:carbamoyltransferase